MNAGTLPATATEVMNVFLRQGAAYRLEGHCDSDCGGIDLTLTDRSAITVADDHLSDDFPVLFRGDRADRPFRAGGDNGFV